MADDDHCDEAGLPSYCFPRGSWPWWSMCNVEDFLNSAGGPALDLLLSRWGLISGLVLVSQFHLVPIVAGLCDKHKWHAATRAIRDAFGPRRSSSIARYLGRNIIILNIYYGTAHPILELLPLPLEHNPFLYSVIFTLVESVIVQKLARFLQTKLKDYNRPDDEWWTKDIISSKFSDFSVPWVHAALCFVTQSALLLIFVLDMNGDTQAHSKCNVNGFHWLVAVLVTIVSGGEECGASFSIGVFKQLRKHKRVQDRPVQYWSRLLFAGFINGFCRDVLLCFAPVALSVSEQDDLVKDCLAIFFISKMDDIDPKTIAKVLEDWTGEPQADDCQEERRPRLLAAEDKEEESPRESPLKAEFEAGVAEIEDQLKRLKEKFELRDGDAGRRAAPTSRPSSRAWLEPETLPSLSSSRGAWF